MNYIARTLLITGTMGVVLGSAIAGAAYLGYTSQENLTKKVEEGRRQGREQGIQEGYVQGKEAALICLDDARWDYVADELERAFESYGLENNYSEGATSLDNTLHILEGRGCFNDISDSVRNRIFR